MVVEGAERLVMQDKQLRTLRFSKIYQGASRVRRRIDCSRDDVCHVRWRTEAEVPVSAPVEGRLTGGSAAEVGIAEKDIGRDVTLDPTKSSKNSCVCEC